MKKRSQNLFLPGKGNINLKVTILQQDLLPKLQSVSRSVGIRATLPVLANILIETESGKLKLSATNLELGVVKLVKAQVSEEGSVTVPAKTFLEIISSLNNNELILESSNEQLKVSSKNFAATINGISASEFPAIPLASEEGILLDGKLLAATLPEITFAAAADEGRPILTGILTEIKKDSLELVATDGFRLAHKTVVLESGEQNFKALIPRRTFEEVVRLISEDLGAEEGEKVEISTSENQNQMIFKIGQTQLSSRLIEGQFPSWEKIVPQKFENRTIVERSEALKAVKLASIFAKDNANVVKFETKDNALKIVSEAKELGAQETEIDAQVEGLPITIAFNARYLLDVLSAATRSQIAIEFSGNLSPALVKPIGEDELEYVIMPIRLS